MDSCKVKNVDMSEKNAASVSKNKIKGEVQDMKTMDTAKKSRSSRRARRGKAKKTADSSDQTASVNHTVARNECDQRIKESKSMTTSTRQGNRPVVKGKQTVTTSKKEGVPPVKREEIKLRPSEIFYSQSSISNQVTDGSDIGHLLDDIYFGRCFVSAIPQIEVSKLKGTWVSADNRRLWVFKQLEVLGKIEFIRVKVAKKIYSGKLTSDNGGKNIEIRGADPSGTLYPLISGDSQKAKRRRRRRRKTKPNPSLNTSVKEVNQNYSDSGINVCQNTSYNKIGEMCHTQQQNNCEVVNDIDEFVLYDSEEWTDDELPDTCPHIGNDAFSHHTWDNSWHECEKLLKNYEVEKLYDEYSETNSLFTLNDFECSDDLDFTTFSDNSATNRNHEDYFGKDFRPSKEENTLFSKSLYKDSVVKEVQQDFGDGVLDRWNYLDDYQKTPDFNRHNYTNFCDCGKFQCRLCARRSGHREMYNWYYEPPCHVISGSYSSKQHSAAEKITEATSRRRSENPSVLTEITRGIEKVVGFFNELFR